MQITLYNTCPAEYDKKFSQILKKVIRPAIRAGKSVKVDEIPGTVSHAQLRSCVHINRKRRGLRMPSKIKKCDSCYIHREQCDRIYSDLTMKISIT